ncbi:MerR family transcriptional regulator [Cytobacillus horneckiae]|uniref:MerR family transcriptional regulator n=1 Tax=Cytobacillus horneckiae TaxID=549687 RepID=A0A2N0ZHM1_9BACI|nr:MerR family transcriptional regulator [Cytobacillus horneckiae]MBN6887689.1 MerR family transcriptional regulator [Cytobacillus horneckiae]MEC1158222.1 MerR family transcriptional regulator [Cytobacillus horneckiae]MED2940134.1 MerR family transcriptional regulator [Cytobacillus horneckiae]PKG29019.1 MerR family transcriptional regulator [Cytobacillus horneckiae]
MGELAKIANVTKRTIDYYTCMGLIHADRSKSNYRIYSENALADLRFIEDCKKMHLPLEEIKRKLEINRKRDIRTREIEKHAQAVALQMKQLQNELSILRPLILKLEEKQKDDVSKLLSVEGTALLRSLVSLKS